MTRIMYDSYSKQWPEQWDKLACYINGIYTSDNYSTALSKFPTRYADILTITVNGDPNVDANICDCETGDYTITAAANWIAQQIQKGKRPTLYGSRSTYPAVVAALNMGHKIQAAQFDWWAATLDGTQQVDNAVAVQYLDNGQWDTSIIWSDTWYPGAGPAPDPPSNTPTNTLREESMQALYNAQGQLVIVGEAIDNGNLLMFTQQKDGSWTVGDVTQGVHNENPSDPRQYKIH